MALFVTPDCPWTCTVRVWVGVTRAIASSVKLSHTSAHHRIPDLKLVATTTLTTTNAVQDDKSMLGAFSPVVKAIVLQVLFVFMKSLSLVSFYHEGSWRVIVREVLSSAFYVPDVMVDFRGFFTWPDFSLPNLEFKLTLGVSFVSIAVFAPYFRGVLSWCYTQPWFAMGSDKPGRWEARLMAVFAGLRWVWVGVWLGWVWCVRGCVVVSKVPL